MKTGMTPMSIRALERRGGRVTEYIRQHGKTVVNYVTAGGQPRTALLLRDDRDTHA